MSWQQTIIIGNVGRVSELKYTQQGVAVFDFSVAVNKVTGRGDDRKEKTVWFKVTVWRERAETASQYVKKGMQIMVVGEIDASAYTNKEGQPAASLELTASNFQFLGSRASGEGGQAAGAGGEGFTAHKEPDEIPF